MRWFIGLRREAARPPSYMVERISDLDHASKLARISPSSSRSVLEHISKQFDAQNNGDYARMTSEAAKVVLDSPNKAIEIINAIVTSMRADKDESEAEARQWKIKIK